jgi:AcrR family transcriptional regulator
MVAIDDSRFDQLDQIVESRLDLSPVGATIQTMVTKRRISAGTQVKPRGDGEMREAILSAARDLLRRYGLRKITMEDIATAMGKRKSFLYYYFAAKTDVIAALADREFAEISAAIRAAVEAKESPADRVQTYFYARTEQIVRRRSEYAEASAGVTTLDDAMEILQLNERRRQFDEGETRYLADLMTEAVRAKAFRALSEKEAQTFCQFALSALRGIELELFLDPKLATGLKARMTLSLDVLFNGLLL